MLPVLTIFVGFFSIFGLFDTPPPPFLISSLYCISGYFLKRMWGGVSWLSAVHLVFISGRGGGGHAPYVWGGLGFPYGGGGRLRKGVGGGRLPGCMNVSLTG